MTGRPRTPVGATGVIRVKELQNGKWVASTRVRDSADKSSPVSAQGTSNAAAKRNLQFKLQQRQESALQAIEASIQAEREAQRAAAEADALRNSHTVRQVAATWLSTRANKGIATSSLARYGDLVRVHINPTFGDREIGDIGITELDDFIQHFADNGQTSQARSTRTVLFGIFDFARRKEWIKVNAARATEPVAPKSKEPDALTDEQLADIRAALDAYLHPAERRNGPLPTTPVDLIVNVMIGAGGLRIGEALALRWRDVNLDADNPTIRVLGTTVEVRNDQGPQGLGLHRQDRPKTSSSKREVRIPEWLRLLLADAPRHPSSELVFATKSGRPYSRTNVYRALRSALDLADVDHFVTHVLRRTVATAVDRKQGLEAASSVVGHSNVVITQRSYVERAKVTADVRVTLGTLAP